MAWMRTPGVPSLCHFRGFPASLCDATSLIPFVVIAYPFPSWRNLHPSHSVHVDCGPLPPCCDRQLLALLPRLSLDAPWKMRDEEAAILPPSLPTCLLTDRRGKTRPDQEARPGQARPGQARPRPDVTGLDRARRSHQYDICPRNRLARMPGAMFHKHCTARELLESNSKDLFVSTRSYKLAGTTNIESRLPTQALCRSFFFFKEVPNPFST